MNGNHKLNKSAGNTPFRRVRDEEVEIDERVKNNSFEAKVSVDISVFNLGVTASLDVKWDGHVNSSHKLDGRERTEKRK